MFIDVVVCWLDGWLLIYKLLLDNLVCYCDVVVVGICVLLVNGEVGMCVDVVWMGIMVVINVLFECMGECILLVIICGFGDVLCIVYQNCLCIFDWWIVLFEMFYEWVVEVDEWVIVDGWVLWVFDLEVLGEKMWQVYVDGICVVVVVCLYSYFYLGYE